MKNSYFIMRHGQSTANAAGIIISRPEHGLLNDYGLSLTGKVQVKTAAEHSDFTAATVIYSSDFSRAQQTANIVREYLGAPLVHLAIELRERNFGNYEMTSNANYQQVWDHDKTDAKHQGQQVESVNQVSERVNALMRRLETSYINKTILLVSHGDTLQILQASLSGIGGPQHRSLPPLATAEIRKLLPKS